MGWFIVLELMGCPNCDGKMSTTTWMVEDTRLGAAGSGQGGWGRAHALDREPQKIKSEGENWQPLTVWRKKSAGVKAENYRLGVASLARERCSEVEKLEPGRVAF